MLAEVERQSKIIDGWEADMSLQVCLVHFGDEKEEVTDLFFNPAHRREARAAAGLPDDGKEWCDSCQKSHLPPVCD